MTDDYYSDERPGAERQLAESGWRREIGQLLRYEAAIAPWDWGAIDSVLDLGCGPGALANYMAETGREARYVGVEARESAVEYAREHVPETAELRQGDIYDPDVVDEAFDLVVAIGAQVDGTAPTGDDDRRERVRRLVERCDGLARRGSAVLVLDQEAIGRRPALGLEPALFGVTHREATESVDRTRELGLVRGDVLETDLALYLRDGSGVFRVEAFSPYDAPAIHERVVAYHLDGGGDRIDVAWLWLEAGRPERAREVLDALRDEEGETEEIRHLVERLEQVSG